MEKNHVHYAPFNAKKKMCMMRREKCEWVRERGTSRIWWWYKNIMWEPSFQKIYIFFSLSLIAHGADAMSRYVWIYILRSLNRKTNSLPLNLCDSDKFNLFEILCTIAISFHIIDVKTIKFAIRISAHKICLEKLPGNCRLCEY